MRAFRLAMEQGADGIELDVLSSADRVPVALHDATLDRTTDARGAVAALPWERIAEARADGEPVPRLEQVVEWAAECGAFLNVEIKEPGVEAAALRAVEAAGRAPWTVFSSFHPEALEALLRLDRRAARYLLTERWDDAVRDTVIRVRAGGVCLHDPIAAPEVLDELREAGFPVVVWTVDDPARMEALMRAGVMAVITNLPAVAVEVRKKVFG